MTDPNEHEKRAIMDAGEQAGQYIEHIGQTDMRAWTEDQWNGFIAAVCGGYVDSLLRQQVEILQATAKLKVAPF